MKTLKINGRFESRPESKSKYFDNEKFPALVVFIYHDEKGRRCTQLVATCDSANRDRNKDADLIASLLNTHFHTGE